MNKEWSELNKLQQADATANQPKRYIFRWN